MRAHAQRYGDEVTDLPLVSCLCITQARPKKLRRSIECFLAQTYANKELLIVLREGDTATRSVAAEYGGRARIRTHVLADLDPMTLGEQRNLSIRLCRGEYFCVWDDDDWYHPERIETQEWTLRKYHKAACMLTHLLLFDVPTGQAYLSEMRLWEGSLLCRTSVVSDTFAYEATRIVEDSPFINRLIQENHAYPLTAPNLYVYERHECNTSGPKLSRLMYSQAQKLSPECSALIGDVMASKLSMVEAARQMRSLQLLEGLNYFHGFAVNMPADVIPKFRQYLESNDDLEWRHY
jgi:glycosyltransferase involved in cell wall biosynthesis